MKSSNEKIITKEDAFWHLIYEYRCLANAAYAWKQIGDSAVSDDNHIKKQANRLIPEIGTLIQDSLLLHTRTLVEYYWPDQPNSTDITINRFVTPVIGNYSTLKTLKRPIEVHVLHLTNWRNPQYRSGASKGVQRPNWNKENGKIFEAFVKALEEFSNNVPHPWKKAIEQLLLAAKERFEKGRDYDWPKELESEKNMNKYLQEIRNEK